MSEVVVPYGKLSDSVIQLKKYKQYKNQGGGFQNLKHWTLNFASLYF